MKATTVKVEGALLAKLEKAKPRDLTLSAFVRSLLEQAVARQQMAEGAERYSEFVRDSSDERAWLAEWDSADLVTPPRRKRR